MPEENGTEVVPVVLVPETAPEEPDNLALHLGRLSESHENLRRDLEACQAERASDHALLMDLVNELQQVEEVIEEVLEEEAVSESASVADPVSHPEEKRAHWLVRGLRGH